MIIGAGKGGTTDLHAQLTDVSVNSDPQRPDPPLLSGKKKEVEALENPALTTADVTPFSPFFRDYLVQLRHPCAPYADGPLRDCLSSCGSGGNATRPGAASAAASVYTMDATPRYHVSTIAPLLLRTFSPYSKMLLMLREPVDRAEALYNHLSQDFGGIFATRTMEEITSDFLSMVDSDPGIKTALRHLASCPDAADDAGAGAATGGGSRARTDVLRCMATGWQDLMAMGLIDGNQ
ncbi:hypothetical protein PLESTB_001550300 [Pleodorina starrii]|uniref:Sulfotransferase n=1 Tax=Pleodorina starrii TaxID=330485 RepID=A0A9W6BXH3_9CHLO|nr:hypothetical protein PLESTB_001550300 [Pleodorina starrii]GLC70203.1 hypothetical protein PLESTF_000937500 [Pleodorina starrii]